MGVAPDGLILEVCARFMVATIFAGLNGWVEGVGVVMVGCSKCSLLGSEWFRDRWSLLRSSSKVCSILTDRIRRTVRLKERRQEFILLVCNRLKTLLNNLSRFGSPLVPKAECDVV